MRMVSLRITVPQFFLHSFPFHSLLQFRISIKQHYTISALSSNSKSSTYFIVQVNFSPIFKSPKPSRASSIRYLLYTLKRFGDKYYPFLTPLPICLSPPGPVLVEPSDPCTVCSSTCFLASRYWFPLGSALIWYSLHGQMCSASLCSKQPIIRLFQRTRPQTASLSNSSSSLHTCRLPLVQSYFNVLIYVQSADPSSLELVGIGFLQDLH